MSKCCVFLLVSLCIVLQIEPHLSLRSLYSKRRFSDDDDCVLPTISKGRARWARRPLARFICVSNYRLVGSKYIACRDGEWEEPAPVCVRPGCAIPSVPHAMAMPMHASAWLEFFCLPGYQMSGAKVIYCDGTQWNGTAPTCMSSNGTAETFSCNFDLDMCGWQQDYYHDFDWKRINVKTPSSMYLTGPSTDHTTGSGYYMYIESTGQSENQSARLVSPVYDAKLSTDGCFSFFYHMYGRYIGGLRVYQKPLSVILEDLKDDEQGLLFEKWYNQGNKWIESVSRLKETAEDFQIIIEGIRGQSYTSDIAIDDVALLQGENCTRATEVHTTTPQPLETCLGRCYQPSAPSSPDCSCTWECFDESTCCQDIAQVCNFFGDTSTTSTASTTTTTTTAAPTTTTAAPTTTTRRTTTAKPTTTSTTTTPKPKTTPKPMRRTLVFKSTTAIYNATGILIKNNKTTSAASITTRKQDVAVTTLSTTWKTTTTHNDRRYSYPKPRPVVKEVKNPSSGKGTAITFAVLLCCAGAACAVAGARTARGRAAIDRLRGRATASSEVRYLTNDQDDS